MFACFWLLVTVFAVVLLLLTSTLSFGVQINCFPFLLPQFHTWKWNRTDGVHTLHAEFHVSACVMSSGWKMPWPLGQSESTFFGMHTWGIAVWRQVGRAAGLKSLL